MGFDTIEINLAVFIIVLVDVVVVLVIVHIVAVDPRNHPLKFGQHGISNS